MTVTTARVHAEKGFAAAQFRLLFYMSDFRLKTILLQQGSNLGDRDLSGAGSRDPWTAGSSALLLHKTYSVEFLILLEILLL